MKRAGRLIEKISDADNLRLAWLKTIRGKRRSQSALRFRENLDERLKGIAQDISDGTYVWGSFRHFTIYDPKERQISVAPLRDRIAYHALMNICEPFFDRYQIDQSCACRKGKGQSGALDLTVRYSQQRHYFLKLDIRKFFDSISHSILKTFLSRLFKDARVLTAFFDLIDSHQSIDSDHGLPIGSLTSQFFANHYLGKLDHFVKETLLCRAYVRYMDDFVLWHDSKNVLLEWKNRVTKFLESQLSLNLKPICLNSVQRGLPFLGCRIFPGQIRLGHRSRIRFRRKYAEAVHHFDQGIWSEEETRRHVEPLFAFVKKAESRTFRLRVLQGDAVKAALPGSTGAGAGTTTPRTAVAPTGTGTIRPTGTTTSACAFL